MSEASATELLQFGGAGHEYRFDTSYYFNAAERTDRPHAVLQLTVAGMGFWSDRRARHLLPPGHAWFDVIPGAFEYGYATQSPRPYELLFVSMRGSAALAWQGRIAARFGRVLPLGEQTQVAPILRDLVRRQSAGTLPDEFATSAILYQLLMTMQSELLTRHVRQHPQARRALQIIERRAGDPAFGVSELARELDLSREHLTRLIRAATGRSAHDEITRVRLRLAAGMLRGSDVKLSMIAQQSGLGDANYLCRVFRKQVGVTPTEFRARAWMTI